jgi:hypothetical protein
MQKPTREDLVCLLKNLGIALGDQVTQATTHIEKLFSATDLSLWMDTVGRHPGGWYHRVKHGHDAFSNIKGVYTHFGAEGVVRYPFELGKDWLTPHGIPVPGTQELHNAGLLGAKDATKWCSVSIGDALVGGLALYSTYRLYKRTLDGKLSKKDCVWATVGCVTKIVCGVARHHPVVILSGLADAMIILDDLFDIKATIGEALGIDVDEVLGRAAKAVAGGLAAGGIAAGGAFAATAAFASASTGTAIASLSGVAATNATFAALGGGALSAGGFGILGGIVALTGGAALIAVGAAAGILYLMSDDDSQSA